MADTKRTASGRGPGRHGHGGHGFQRPKDMKGTFKKLMHYVGRYKGSLVLVAVCLIVSSVASVATSYMLKPLLNNYIIPGDFPGLFRMLLLMGGLFALSSLCSYAYARIMVHVAQHTVAALRQDLFDRLQELPIRYYDRHQSGDLMSRFTNDIDTVSEMLNSSFASIISNVLTFVGTVVMMLVLNPWLTLIPLCVLPVIGFLAVRMENRLGTVYDQISEETARLNTVAQECIAGVRTVKAFAREEYEIKKFSRHNRRFYDLNMKQAKLLADHQPAISFFGKMMLLAVVIVGGFLVIGGKMSLGDLGAFSEYANNVIWPMEILGWLSNDIASAFASWKKIQKVAKSEPQIKDAEDAKALPQIEGRITFDHVSLTRGGQEILHDVSFEVKPGHTLGIMGMTGTGKTTIVSLLQRFYDVTDGRILLDGTDIRKIPLAQLRASLAVVMQEVFLFSDSVSENVRTGQREAITQETVEWAAERAGAGAAVGFLLGIAQRERGKAETETVIRENFQRAGGEERVVEPPAGNGVGKQQQKAAEHGARDQCLADKGTEPAENVGRDHRRKQQRERQHKAPYVGVPEMHSGRHSLVSSLFSMCRFRLCRIFSKVFSSSSE